MSTRTLCPSRLLALMMAVIASTAQSTEIPATSRKDQATLGAGYNSRTQKFVGQCLDARYETRTGVPESFVQLTRIEESESVRASLGFGVGMRAQFGLVGSAMGSAQFAQASTASTHSESLTFVFTSHYKNVKLERSELLADARKKLGNGEFAGDGFVAACGDEFVEQIELGAKLYFTVSLEFRSQEEKQSFNSEIGFSSAFGEVKAKLQQAQARFKNSASVKIFAYQLGGDVNKLAHVMGRRPDNSNPHAVVSCNLSNLEACEAVLSAALDYATGKDADAFPQQISDDPKRLAYLSYITQPWSSAFVSVRPRELQDAVAEARSDLGLRFSELLATKVRLTQMKGRIFRLSAQQSQMVERFYQGINQKLAEIMGVVEVCYGEKDLECRNRLNVFEQGLADWKKSASFSDKALDVVPESFAQWCDFSGYAEGAVLSYEATPEASSVSTPVMASDRILETVRAVGEYVRKNKAKAPGENWPKNVRDVCGTIETFIAESASHQLVIKTRARDLRPLRSFLTLRSLTISGAEVTSLEGLEGLTQLKHLDLSSNSISDLSALSTLKRLQILDLSGNHVGAQATEVLQQLPELVLLKITGTPLSDLELHLARSDAEVIR